MSQMLPSPVVDSASCARTIAPLTDREFDRIREIVTRDTGVHLGALKREFVSTRLSSRVRALGLESFHDYIAKMRTDPAERSEMFHCVLDSGTRFFRESRQLDYLERLVIPRWISDAHAGRRARAARVWSAGCSTGQEPLSLAMILLAQVPGWTLEILATDLSARLLAQASSATFPLANAEEIPSRLRRKFTLRAIGRDGDRMTVCDRVRSIIRYHRVNLNGPLPETGPFDVIVCANVLDYFDAASRSAAVKRLVQRLAPGGYLVLGEADGPIDQPYLRPVARSIYRAER